MAAAAILGAIRTVAGEFVNFAPASQGAYRPAYWNGGNVTTITVPGDAPQDLGGTLTQNNTTGNIQVLSRSTAGTPATVYVFDGIGRRQHNHRARPTRLPTQTGAAVTDHVIIEPTQLVLDLLMSDTMDSYTQEQWNGAATKSVTAFQVLESIRLARKPLMITTKLYTYTNMVVTDLRAIDDKETQFGLRCLATFDQIIIGSISVQPLSARPQLTNTTSQGQIGSGSVPSSITSTNGVTTLTSVPGAGFFSSNPAGS